MLQHCLNPPDILLSAFTKYILAQCCRLRCLCCPPAPHCTLQPDKPIWRNNWAAAYTGDLTMPSYNVGGPGAQLEAMGGSRPPATDLWLKTEYQTLRRLPQSKAILFTIRTFVQPMPEIGAEAAKVLHKSLSGMTPSLREYKGVPGEAAEELLLLLESMMAAEEAAAKAPAAAISAR
jgi:hypothetical protein